MSTTGYQNFPLQNLVLRQKEAPDEKMGKVGGKKGRGGAEAVQRRGDASLDRSWMADFEVRASDG